MHAFLVAVYQLVDPSLAAQILTESRLVDHVQMVENHYDVICALPSHNALNAEVNCVGSGDFASCFYSFPVSCGGAVGGVKPHSISIKIERTQLGPLLNLNMTTNFLK
jgi:hypothetical protein